MHVCVEGVGEWTLKATLSFWVPFANVRLVNCFFFYSMVRGQWPDFCLLCVSQHGRGSPAANPILRTEIGRKFLHSEIPPRI